MRIDLELAEWDVLLKGLETLNQSGQSINGSMQIIGLAQKITKETSKSQPIKEAKKREEKPKKKK